MRATHLSGTSLKTHQAQPAKETSGDWQFTALFMCDRCCCFPRQELEGWCCCLVTDRTRQQTATIICLLTTNDQNAQKKMDSSVFKVYRKKKLNLLVHNIKLMVNLSTSTNSRCQLSNNLGRSYFLSPLFSIFFAHKRSLRLNMKPSVGAWQTFRCDSRNND